MRRRNLAEGSASDSRANAVSSEGWSGADGLGREVDPEAEDEHRRDERHDLADATQRGTGRQPVERRGQRPITRPMPAITAAMPSPNATTSTNPNPGRPAAMDPSRISRALVDGMRPPARPSTNRLRHVIVDPEPERGCA